MTLQHPQKILHPDRFIWDFWHLWDEELQLFHLFFLNAPKPSVRGERYHHLARIGYAVSPDFHHIDWIDDDVFLSNPSGWDNAAIWSGDVIKVAGGWLLGYTGRDLRAADKFVQTIGFAFSPDMLRWERLPELTLPPHPEWYETAAVLGDDSIHAWRDPNFLLRGNQLEIIFFAKAKALPVGHKACVGRARLNGQQNGWEVLPPLVATGEYSEMDVPQLLKVNESEYRLLYSVGTKYDKSAATSKQGGAQSMKLVEDKTSGELKVVGQPEVHVPASHHLYAFRAVAELKGELIGFDVDSGGWVHGGVQLPCMPSQRSEFPYKFGR